MKRTICLILLGLIQSVTYSKSFPATSMVSVSDTNQPPRQVELKLNGQARCVWGFFRVKLYDIALFLEEPSDDPQTILASDQVKRIELVFLRKLSQRQLEKAYRAAVGANTNNKVGIYQTSLDQLCNLLPAVRKGDRFVFTIIPEKGLQIAYNQEIIGIIQDNKFANLFVNLYIGPHPPTTAVRVGLLGL